jgi:hypothetical protein
VRLRHWAAALPLPFLLSGCGVLDTLTGGSSVGSAGATPVPSGSPWIIVAPGSATPSPAPSYPTSSPTATTPIAGALRPPGPTPVPTSNPTCATTTYDLWHLNSLTVTPGTTSAKVSWHNVGGFNPVQFRLTAISQHLVSGKQRDVGWVSITPPSRCGLVSATITGLSRKTPYVFSVDAVVTRISGDGTRAATIVRSAPIYTK